MLQQEAASLNLEETWPLSSHSSWQSWRSLCYQNSHTVIHHSPRAAGGRAPAWHYFSSPFSFSFLKDKTQLQNRWRYDFLHSRKPREYNTGEIFSCLQIRNNKMTYLKLCETMINTNKCVKFISSEYLKVKLNHFLDVKCPGIERNLGTWSPSHSIKEKALM